MSFVSEPAHLALAYLRPVSLPALLRCRRSTPKSCTPCSLLAGTFFMLQNPSDLFWRPLANMRLSVKSGLCSHDFVSWRPEGSRNFDVAAGKG